MEDLGLYLISILLLIVFVILIVWILFRIGQMIRMIKKSKEEIIDKKWCQEQLSKFTDEELQELLNKLNLNE